MGEYIDDGVSGTFPLEKRTEGSRMSCPMGFPSPCQPLQSGRRSIPATIFDPDSFTVVPAGVWRGRGSLIGPQRRSRMPAFAPWLLRKG